MIEGTALDLAGHLLAMLLAAGLFAVSVRAYAGERSPRFKFVAAAFGLFAVKEVLLFFNISVIDSGSLTGVSHVLNLLIIAVFFRGTLR